VSRKAASVSAYALITHCRSDNDAPNDCSMSGSATFTIVMSSRSMKTPVPTAASVHHLFRESVLCMSFLLSKPSPPRTRPAEPQ
jgi:hypothetical protein